MQHRQRRGSPPRMRGKDLVQFSLCPRFGITPAYAGKSPGRLMVKPLPGDHPRVCGEKKQFHKIFRGARGSPPRMRGKAPRIAAARTRPGITPAYAGKRLCLTFFLAILWDHPRVCGEKTAATHPAQMRRGSPPRMRGKDLKAPQMRLGFRITPAYAGKSPSLLSSL